MESGGLPWNRFGEVRRLTPRGSPGPSPGQIWASSRNQGGAGGNRVPGERQRRHPNGAPFRVVAAPHAPAGGPVPLAAVAAAAVAAAAAGAAGAAEAGVDEPPRVREDEPQRWAEVDGRARDQGPWSIKRRGGRQGRVSRDVRDIRDDRDVRVVRVSRVLLGLCSH
eukprot:gene13376-biopygen1852